MSNLNIVRDTSRDHRSKVKEVLRSAKVGDGETSNTGGGDGDGGVDELMGSGVSRRGGGHRDDEKDEDSRGKNSLEDDVEDEGKQKQGMSAF